MPEENVSLLHPTLPVFSLRLEGRRVVYAPGHLAVLKEGQEVPATLIRCAQDAQRAWQESAESPFAPECLTVYLSNRCNSSCSYCFAGRTGTILEEEAALGAARLVAAHCAAKGLPFHLVASGGGEPTMEWDLLVRLREVTARMAEESSIGWDGYIATNGAVSEKQAEWLARNFNLVGLSCDGPPEIQARQRSSIPVEQTARVLAAAGGRFQVRSTITPATAERMQETVAYLHEQLGVTRMRFEPVYRTRFGFIPEQADWFVNHFLAAEREARQRRCELTLSGVRLEELHGPYCAVLSNNLLVVPGGVSMACFLRTDGADPSSTAFVTGRWDQAAGEFQLDRERISALRRAAARVPAACARCLCRFHCARDCPDFCYIDGGTSGETGGFRCRVQKKLMEKWLLEAAASCRSEDLGRHLNSEEMS